MSDLNSNSWSKKSGTSESPTYTEEKIILPNEDVFDLNDFIKQNNNQNIENLEPEHKSVNPENIRHQDEEKYFYKSNKIKSKDGSIWFILTFLMTLIILGSIYFYFLIEDKNNQISGLERQLSNKADNRVKGVKETNQSQNSNATITSETINVSPFSILQNNQNPEFKISTVSVAIPYFNNQIGSKSTLSKESQVKNQKYIDKIEVYSAEKQDLLSKNDIIKKVIESEKDFEVTSTSLNSANNISFTEIKNKLNEKNKIYIGTSQNYMYVLLVFNESNGIETESKINIFFKNIITNTSFN